MRYLNLIIIQLILVFPVLSKLKPNDDTFATNSKFIHDVCITPSGKVLICSDNHNLKAFDVKTKKLLAEFTNGHTSKVLTVDISADSTIIASGGRDSIVVIWDVKTHKMVEKLSFTTGKVCSVKFSPDSKLLAIACSNAKVYLYSVPDKKCVYIFENQQKEFIKFAFNYYGNLLAITGKNHVINIYNTTTFANLQVLKGHKSEIRSLAFYNYGNALLSCGDDGKFIDWKIASNKLIRKEKSLLSNSWNMCLDVENIEINKYNMRVLGTITGKVFVKTLFANYTMRLNCPLNQIRIIPREDGVIELVVATLGKGLITLKAKDMKLN